MSAQKKPVLSIGVIFKNEIRCMERCLKSLEPLREAVPCELVMADTGSTDGSREIAERYADILFDFPWVNDFSAARNAVMDRCSGEWYFSIDCDEWLDGEIAQLTEFLRSAHREDYNFCSVLVRNYTSEDLRENYGDFIVARLARLLPEVRYAGAIHESWPIGGKAIFALEQIVLHHDGYVGLGEEAGRAKRERNLSLLRKELEAEPDNLRLLLQCIESTAGDQAQEDYVRRGVEGVKRKLHSWETLGAPIFRCAVFWAAKQAPEELEAALKDARTWFPDALCTRIDVEYVAFSQYFDRQEYEKAVFAGERYLNAIEDYRAGRFDREELHYDSVNSLSPHLEGRTRIALAAAYFQTRAYEKAREMLLTLNIDRLDGGQLKDFVGILCDLQAQSGMDVSDVMLNLWNYLDAADQQDEKTGWRLGVLADAAARVFPRNFREAEAALGFSHAYTLFLPLAGKWDVGTAAGVLSLWSCEEISSLLEAVEDWSAFPAAALAHALDYGVRFPLADKPLKLEEMDALAAGLTAEPETLRGLVLEADPAGADTQTLGWMRAATLALVQGCAWEDEARDMPVARKFAEMERAFLPRCYSPEALTEDGVFLLPPLHRFGFYCDKAFQALDSGDLTGYVRQLRAGLESSHGQKKMVEFLLARVDDMGRAAQIASAPAELRALADQVRTILARFAPDDPTVQELKQSEVYQKVAYLIEGAEVPITGGLIQ